MTFEVVSSILIKTIINLRWEHYATPSTAEKCIPRYFLVFFLFLDFFARVHKAFNTSLAFIYSLTHLIHNLLLITANYLSDIFIYDHESKQMAINASQLPSAQCNHMNMGRNLLVRTLEPARK